MSKDAIVLLHGFDHDHRCNAPATKEHRKMMNCTSTRITTVC